MPTHIRVLGKQPKERQPEGAKQRRRQLDRCRRLSGCLTDSQKVGVAHCGGVVKNGSLLFFVLFYVAFIRVFLSSFNRRDEAKAKA